MNKPLVSIIMPTYKRADLIERAIKSVLNQTYKNIELIIIDDNEPSSIDRKSTEKVLKKYEKNKKVIYLKNSKNLGACISRNKGIKKAKGVYATFIDDDDEYYPDKIEKEVTKIQEGYDMIFSNIEIYFPDTGTSIIQAYEKNFSYNRKDLLRKHLVDVISGGIAFMYRRDKLLEIGGFDDIEANQEYVLMLKTIDNNLKISYLDETLCRGYHHHSNVRITGSKKAINAKIKVIDIIKPYLKEIDLKDRRKTLFRLYLFVFYQTLKRKDVRFIKYGLKLIPYIDLLLLKLIKKEKMYGNKIYR